MHGTRGKPVMVQVRVWSLWVRIVIVVLGLGMREMLSLACDHAGSAWALIQRVRASRMLVVVLGGCNGGRCSCSCCRCRLLAMVVLACCSGDGGCSDRSILDMLLFLLVLLLSMDRVGRVRARTGYTRADRGTIQCSGGIVLAVMSLIGACGAIGH